MSGPPDKFYGLSTKGMTDPKTLATQLSTLYALGYTTLFAAVPSPVAGDSSTWLVLGGYSDSVSKTPAPQKT
jgi:hypothetical protein